MKHIVIILAVGLLLACSSLDHVVQIERIDNGTPALEAPVVINVERTSTPTISALTPTMEPILISSSTLTPTAGLVPTPRSFLSRLSTTPSDELQARNLPYARHGLWIAFVLPLVFFGFPWIVLEIIVAGYVQPRGSDLAKVLIKAQDGLFINAVVSMTARKRLSLVSLTISWPRVRDVVEKAVEQELIHEALNYTSLVELENGLKEVAERFTQLPVIEELSRDFGVEVLRFNIEIQYPSETIDALNRRAEASAGGQAYIAYARSAHLDPESPEARALYEVFQKTSSQVDAARNLGSGISGLAGIITQNNTRPNKEDDSEAPN